MSGQFANFSRKVFGDHRNKTTALHEAGFDSEAAAAQRASSITAEPLAEVSEPALIKHIHQARPDLTLATASYIAQRAKVRTA